MKKIISVKKGLSFNKRSNVFLEINNKRILMDNFETKKIEITEKDEIQLRYRWVKSEKLNSSHFENDKLYEITQLLGKKSGLTFLLIFSISIVLFFITNSIWLSIPILGVGVYIIVIITMFSHRYLNLKEINS